MLEISSFSPSQRRKRLYSTSVCALLRLSPLNPNCRVSPPLAPMLLKFWKRLWWIQVRWAMVDPEPRTDSIWPAVLLFWKVLWSISASLPETVR